MHQNAKPDKDYFNLYCEYAKTLRAWLVGFGIGTPAVFFTQDQIRQVVVHAACHVWLIALFMAGVACQVLVALINKWVNWYVFLCQTQGKTGTPAFARCFRYSNNMTVDFVFDVTAVICFAGATIWTAMLFTGIPGTK